MDDELSQFEAELKRLRPAAPSPELRARIADELEACESEPQRRLRAWWIWAGALPVAAAVAIVVFVGRGAPTPAELRSSGRSSNARSADKAFQPVSAENVLYAAQDEGLIRLSDGTPARQERLNYVDTITWKNPRTNALVRWSIPREEVRVVPVNFQ